MAHWSEEPLVGRAAIIDELVAAATTAARGNGSVIVLTGEAGVGKTSVARTLAQRVGDVLAVSWGGCVADQSAPPFWPWHTLVRPRPTDPRSGTDRISGSRRYEQLAALRDEVRRQVLSEPRLHIIEDLQWADVASALLLVHLGTTVSDVPLLVVATLRTGEPRSPQLDDAIEALSRVSRLRDLPALDDGDIASLMRAAGAEPDEHLVALVRVRTGGNPLFVGELLRAIPASLPPDRRRHMMAESVPARVSDLIVHRLNRLPPSVADALITASAIGAEGDVATLAAANGTEIDSLLDLLDQARAVHLLGPAAAGAWQFRHQLIRDAVYASVTEANRARRHALILEAVAADPSAPPFAVAHHALAALPLVDADRAVALAARAGEAALSQHAYEEAIAWFTRALAAAPGDTSPRWRAELLVRTGESHRHIAALETARHAFTEAAELADDPSLLARAALGYADPGADLGIAYRTEDPVTAVLLERAIAAQPSADSATTVQLEARLAAELYFSDEPARAGELAKSALDRARRLGDVRALGTATALAHDAFVVGQADLDRQLAESTQLVEWAREIGSATALLTARRARVIDLLAAGDIPAVDAEILAFRRLVEPLQAPEYVWWPMLWSAMRALLEGRHDVAEERALAAYQVGASAFPALSFINLSFLLFFLRREQGRLVEMEQATRDYAASHADVPALRVALTFLLAELGRVDEVRAMLAAFDDAALARLHDRNWPASWFQLARVASITGDRTFAATLLEPRHRPSERCVQVSLATVCLGASDLATAWLMHTVSDFDGADEHYRAAEELNARMGARSWLAQTRADHARLLVDRGRAADREEASRLVDLAQQVAQELGLATFGLADPVLPKDPERATFRKEASSWHLSFGGRTVQIPDARGLRDLRYLLSRPGELVSVLDLVGDAGTAPAARGAPVLDDRARREIRARLRALDADEADAEASGDGERAALAREQRQTLAEAVARDFGLGGRPRLIGDPVERARKTVSTRIRRVIASIARVHPELGRHLERSIDTGAWCAYRPAEPVDWHT
jgi:tetratricopeptide (TPR) repeat protein